MDTMGILSGEVTPASIAMNHRETEKDFPIFVGDKPTPLKTALQK